MFQMNKKYAIAGAIVIALGAWLITGIFSSSKRHDNGVTKAAASELTKVRVAIIHAQAHEAELIIRGKTQAIREVQVKSETAGRVVTIAAEKGTPVKAGDLLCQLAPDAREAQVAQAKAKLAQSTLEFDAADKLAKKGFRSQTQVAEAKATLDASTASEREAEIELERTNLRAPFDGVADARFVNVGDYMRAGDPCETVVDLDPILIVGSVSAEEVAGLAVGNDAVARLITGAEIQGHVRFVAQSADPSTRTFAIEIEAANPDHVFRDGVSADVRVGVRKVLAHHISPGILTLAADGKIGVRVVDKGIVHFMPIQIVSDDPDGMWVLGLPETVAVITVGQEYVSDGQKVDTTVEAPAPGGGQS
jgi:membrane fusion protein, multidrug efflux system